LPASYDETTRTPPPASRLPAERRARVAAPPIRKEIGGIHPSILPPGPRPGQVPVLTGCDTREIPGPNEVDGTPRRTPLPACVAAGIVATALAFGLTLLALGGWASANADTAAVVDGQAGSSPAEDDLRTGPS
jgi:hypothetical protein